MLNSDPIVTPPYKMASRQTESLALLLVLALSACGRLGFEPVAISEDEGDDITKPELAIDAAIVNEIIVAQGWSYEVLLDLSDDFAYVEQDFLDGALWQDNIPTDFIPLGSPFHLGVAVLVGRVILDYNSTTGQVIHRDYAPAESNTTGPDIPVDLVYAPPGVDSMAAPGIWLGAGSLGGGDGLFRLDLDWNLVSSGITTGNVAFIAPDVNANVPPRLTSATYFGLVSANAASAGIDSVGNLGPKLVVGNMEDGRILADGRMLVVEGDFSVIPRVSQVAILEGGSLTSIDAFFPDTQRIVRGDVSAFGSFAMIVRATGSLRSGSEDGSWQEIARESLTHWQWSSGHAVSAGVLGVDTASILVLRARLDTSELQLLRFWRP